MLLSDVKGKTFHQVMTCQTDISYAATLKLNAFKEDLRAYHGGAKFRDDFAINEALTLALEWIHENGELYGSSRARENRERYLHDLNSEIS